MDGHRKADLRLDELLVNPENYRFDPVSDQQEAMLTMIRSQGDKILKLGRDIAKRGLNPMEILMVKEIGDGKYIVLEGNRRITVLKLMANPDELQGEYPYKGFFEELHDKYKNSLPTTVACSIYRADQQDSADGWIELKHTGENQGIGTVGWNSVQKQRFASRNSEQEPRTLQILDFLKENGINASGVNVTNLERILGTRGVPQMLGIDFPRKQKFILIEPQEVVLQKFRRVVERMSTDEFAVSQIYTAPQRMQWIQDILASLSTTPDILGGTDTSQPEPTSGDTNPPPIQPAPSPTSGPDSNPGPQQHPTGGAGTTPPDSEQPSPVPEPDPGPGRPPNPSPPSSYSTLVNPANMLPATVTPKVLEIYKELQTVYITGPRAAPHAVGALLRILVEITAQEYLMKVHGFTYDRSNNFRSPTDPNKPYKDLRDRLNYIANQSNLPGNIAQVLRTLLAQQLITAELNQVMHSTLFTADAVSIKGLWKNFEKVFDYLINEIK